MAWLIVGASMAACALIWNPIERMDAADMAGPFYPAPPVMSDDVVVDFRRYSANGDVAGLMIVAAGVVLVQSEN